MVGVAEIARQPISNRDRFCARSSTLQRSLEVQNRNARCAQIKTSVDFGWRVDNETVRTRDDIPPGEYQTQRY